MIMRPSVYILSALAVLVVGIYFFCEQLPEKEGEIAMSPTFALNDEELRQLPKQALAGECSAASRLGDFYMTQMSNTDEAERWYRMADRCTKDPRIKEFLLRTIVLNGKSNSRIKDVIRLYRELEVIDSERAGRVKDYAEEYVGGRL